MDDKKLPGIAADDIGKCAYGIFKRHGEFIGETVGIAGEHLTGSQMATALTNALEEEVTYDPVSPEVYRRRRFKGAKELANMFQFKRDFQNVFCRMRSVELSRVLNPSLESFDQWLARDKSLLSGI